MTKIALNKDDFDTVTQDLEISGRSLVCMRNGLSERDNLNLHTVDEMESLYGKITTLIQHYGTLLIRDSGRFSEVATHMKEFDDKMGRLK